MPAAPHERIGVFLLAMGGPAKVDEVEQYLRNIFSDRAIINLPGGKLFQKPLAWLIASRRAPSVRDHYSLIGGSSPLFKWTDLQRVQLAKLLSERGIDVRCYIGMRYTEPTVEKAISQAVTEGCTKAIFLPMYPHFCRATTGSSFGEAQKAARQYGLSDTILVNDYHDHPMYISLMKKYIDENIEPHDILLFSAHSIPQKFADSGDPYVDQIKKTAALAAGNRDYHLSFQSLSGPVKWVGPDTINEAIRLSDSGARRLFVVPLSFLCDHIETLYEIDIELAEFVKDAGGLPLARMPMFNDDMEFTKLLADLVEKKVTVGVT